MRERCKNCAMAIRVKEDRPGFPGTLVSYYSWCAVAPKRIKVSNDHWCGQYKAGGPKKVTYDPQPRIDLERLQRSLEIRHAF